MEFGKVAFNEGIYQGEVENGMANGYGVIKFFNGDVYIGEMKNNCMTGMGAKSTARYITLGDFNNGKRHGHCCTVEKAKLNTGLHGYNGYFDPEYYIGGYSNDLKGGKGTYLYKNGDAYDGNFQNDLPNGKGAYSYNSSWPERDGYFAVGNFVNGKLVGSYTEYGWTKFAKGDIFYGNVLSNYDHFYYGYGEWVDSNLGKERRIGYHTRKKGVSHFDGATIYYKYNFGQKYSMQVGDFEKYSERANFSRIHRNLDMYIGGYRYGRKDGEGVYSTIDNEGNIKELYIGNFRDGSRRLDNITISSDGLFKKATIGQVISIQIDGRVHKKDEKPHPETRPYKNIRDYIKNKKPNVWVDTIIQEELPIYEGILNGGVKSSQAVQSSQNMQPASGVQQAPQTSVSQNAADGNQTAVGENKTTENTQSSNVEKVEPVKPTPPPPPPKPKKEFEIEDGELVEYNGKDDYVVVPEQVTKIGESAFSNAKGFLTRVAFYDTLKEIGENAFEGCSKLEQVELSASLETIGDGVFKNCTSLKHIKRIPDGLKTIGENAFAGCESLSRFTVPFGCDYDKSSFPQTCRVYEQREPDPPSDFQVEFKTLRKYVGCDENVIIPNTANSMWPEAFNGVKKTLKSVVIPEGFSSIYNYTFKDCEKLEKVVLPASLKEIQKEAFSGCKNLSEINFPDGLKKIGDNAFAGCECLKEIRIVDTCQYSKYDAEKLSFPKDCKVELFNLKVLEEEKFVKENFDIVDRVLRKYIGNGEKVVIPKNVKQILSDAFVDAKELLKQVTIPEGVTKIEQETFAGCKNLRKVELSSTVKEIGERTFFDCSALKEINIPDGLKKIGNRAFDKCYGLREITLPDDCSFAEAGVLQSFVLNCKIISNKQPFKIVNGKLLEYRGTKTEIVIPSKVKHIDKNAFDRVRESLTQVVLPKNMTKIDFSVFADCKSLTKVQLPENLNKIEVGAFSNCVSLEEIEFPDGLKHIETYVFSGCTKLKSVTLPKECEYVLAFPKDCKVNVTKKEIGTLKETIKEEPKPVVFDIRNGVLVHYLGKDEVVVVPDNVIQIGSNAFCFAKNFVRQVIIPKGVTEIGSSAFKDCEKLERVELPESVKVIGMRAFENCKNLEQISLYESLEKVEESAFDGCLKLKLPDFIKNYENYELDEELFIIDDEEDDDGYNFE